MHPQNHKIYVINRWCDAANWSKPSFLLYPCYATLLCWSFTCTNLSNCMLNSHLELLLLNTLQILKLCVVYHVSFIIFKIVVNAGNMEFIQRRNNRLSTFLKGELLFSNWHSCSRKIACGCKDNWHTDQYSCCRSRSNTDHSAIMLRMNRQPLRSNMEWE